MPKQPSKAPALKELRFRHLNHRAVEVLMRVDTSHTRVADTILAKALLAARGKRFVPIAPGWGDVTGLPQAQLVVTAIRLLCEDARMQMVLSDRAVRRKDMSEALKLSKDAVGLLNAAEFGPVKGSIEYIY